MWMLHQEMIYPTQKIAYMRLVNPASPFSQLRTSQWKLDPRQASFSRSFIDLDCNSGYGQRHLRCL